MKGKNNFVFIGLHVVAWIIFLGSSIEAGALIVNFGISLYNPNAIQNLYEKLNLMEMYQRSQWAFFSMYSFVMVIALLKASLFYMVILLLNKFKLEKPFDNFVSKKVNQISYMTLSIGILSYIARQTAKGLQHRGFDINRLNDFWADSQAFILMAAVIYVIAKIISKGIELQNENDLTV